MMSMVVVMMMMMTMAMMTTMTVMNVKQHYLYHPPTEVMNFLGGLAVASTTTVLSVNQKTKQSVNAITTALLSISSDTKVSAR